MNKKYFDHAKPFFYYGILWLDKSGVELCCFVSFVSWSDVLHDHVKVGAGRGED